MKIYRAVFLILVSLHLCACSLIARSIAEKPKVELESIRLDSADGAGAKLFFGVKVTNPNSFALKVDSIKYDVQIDDRPCGAGTIDQPFEIPAKNAKTVEVPMALKFSDLLAGLTGFLEKKKSRYRIVGQAKTGLLTVPFEGKGEFSLNQ